MIRIAVFINSNNGCTLHRLLIPFHKMAHMDDEFDILFVIPKLEQSELEIADNISQYNYFIFNRSASITLLEAIRAKGVKIICDNDDDWILGKNHPLYMHYQINKVGDRIVKCMELSDAVITTNEYLADKIRKVNPNVYIIPNALCSEDLFSKYDKKEQRIRFGLIGSSSHTDDMQLIDGITKQIMYYDKSLLDKILFVLCGFDNGTTNVYEIGTNRLLRREDVPAEKTCWGEWERSLTDNYSILSDSYREFLLSYIEEDLIKIDEPYVRIWTKDIFEYANLYNCIDVLLVPLKDNEFNKSKSNLKLVEASVKGKAVICSDVMPYSPYLKNRENCIAIKNKKGIRAWVVAIAELVNNAELLEKITKGLADLTAEDGEFNLENVTKQRIEIFKTKL